MISEVVNYKRKDIFDHYNSCDNPFTIITTEFDVTNVVDYCKKNGNFYATLGYLITEVVNNIEEFKYRYSNDKIYYCDEIRSNYTEMYDDKSIGYFDLPIIHEYSSYIEEFNKIKNEFLLKKEYMTGYSLDEIWISCAPWFKFNGLITPFNKNVTIPQFIWDKYECKNGKYYINMMIMIHHGFADGYHIGLFINELQNRINSFK